jgi:hypothetical protein
MYNTLPRDTKGRCLLTDQIYFMLAYREDETSVLKYVLGGSMKISQLILFFCLCVGTAHGVELSRQAIAQRNVGSHKGLYRNGESCYMRIEEDKASGMDNEYKVVFKLPYSTARVSTFTNDRWQIDSSNDLLVYTNYEEMVRGQFKLNSVGKIVAYYADNDSRGFCNLNRIGY